VRAHFGAILTIVSPPDLQALLGPPPRLEGEDGAARRQIHWNARRLAGRPDKAAASATGDDGRLQV
jgi:hypothetical protein